MSHPIVCQRSSGEQVSCSLDYTFVFFFQLRVVPFFSSGLRRLHGERTMATKRNGADGLRDGGTMLLVAVAAFYACIHSL